MTQSLPGVISGLLERDRTHLWREGHGGSDVRSPGQDTPRGKGTVGEVQSVLINELQSRRSY